MSFLLTTLLLSAVIFALLFVVTRLITPWLRERIHNELVADFASLWFRMSTVPLVGFTFLFASSDSRRIVDLIGAYFIAVLVSGFYPLAYFAAMLTWRKIRSRP
jgi:hypothetical protein